MVLYSLYFDENKLTLEINKKKNWILNREQEQIILRDSVIKFKTTYFLGIDRKILIIKANEIKKEWIFNADLRVAKLQELGVNIKR